MYTFRAALITTSGVLVEGDDYTTFDDAATWCQQGFSPAVREAYVYQSDNTVVFTFEYNFQSERWYPIIAVCSHKSVEPKLHVIHVDYDTTYDVFICQWWCGASDNGGYASFGTFRQCIEYASQLHLPIIFYGPVQFLTDCNFYQLEETPAMTAAHTDYVQQTLPCDAKPYFDYKTQVSLGMIGDKQPYSDITPVFHYHDCRCAECYKLHYPCEQRDTCEYCKAVFSLMYRINLRKRYDNEEPEFTATGLSVKAERGHIIDYITYQELGDVDVYPYELVWAECRFCDILICEYTARENEGYCSAECQENDSRIWCRKCGDIEVREDGDTCRDCTIYCACGECECTVRYSGDYHEDCPYGSGYDDEKYDDGSGYCAGDVVSPSDYAGLMNCWIDTRGRVRYVAYCNHDYTASRMGYSGSCDAESHGNIHFSEYWDSYNRWRYIPDNPTNAQIDTMMALCLANPETLETPEILKKRQAAIMADEPREVTPLTYSTFESTLPRKLREMLRPLMGD